MLVQNMCFPNKTIEKCWDTIIVGQGLAGTTLAWKLQDAGQKVLLIDAQERITSSKIAAGLITPITGKRLSLSWRFDELLPLARTFYQRVERCTGQSFFHERTALRLFKSEDEQKKWSRRKLDLAYQQYLLTPQPQPLTAVEAVNSSAGGFAMRASQLDVAAFLQASLDHFSCETMMLDWHSDVKISENGIKLKKHSATRVISCEGYAAAHNPYFSWIPFRAAKGEILTVRFARPLPSQTLHRNIWIAPTAEEDVFKVGATYEWDKLDQHPTTQAREQIESALQTCIKIPYTVLEHFAAVRPIIHQSLPVVGIHPKHPQLGYFNGLGSKGSLLAPWCAQALANFLLDDEPLPIEVDLQTRFPN